MLPQFTGSDLEVAIRHSPIANSFHVAFNMPWAYFLLCYVFAIEAGAAPHTA
jgi:hypothetical protein